MNRRVDDQRYRLRDWTRLDHHCSLDATSLLRRYPKKQFRPIAHYIHPRHQPHRTHLRMLAIPMLQPNRPAPHPSKKPPLTVHEMPPVPLQNRLPTPRTQPLTSAHAPHLSQTSVAHQPPTQEDSQAHFAIDWKSQTTGSAYPQSQSPTTAQEHCTATVPRSMLYHA